MKLYSWRNFHFKSKLGSDQVQLTMKSVCIVGAGPGGLCAVRHCLNQGFNVTAFETISEVGGTWVYTEKIGVDDEHGIEVHSSLYKDLLTNLPVRLWNILIFHILMTITLL